MSSLMEDAERNKGDFRYRDGLYDGRQQAIRDTLEVVKLFYSEMLYVQAGTFPGGAGNAHSELIKRISALEEKDVQAKGA
jgi:hypothetical protein